MTKKAWWKKRIRKTRTRKKGIIKRIKRTPVSIIIVGLITGSIGGLIIASCLSAIISIDRDLYLHDGMFYMFFGMGFILLTLSYVLLSGKYKLSQEELEERRKREPDLTCKNCGRIPSLYIDYESGSKTLYGNRCPYCGRRMY